MRATVAAQNRLLPWPGGGHSSSSLLASGLEALLKAQSELLKQGQGEGHRSVTHLRLRSSIRFTAMAWRLTDLPTSFRMFKGRPPVEPPIHCGGADHKERLEMMQLRSAGERSTGREVDGPATRQLKNEMAQEEGQVLPKASKKHDFKGMKKETLITTPFRIERLWTEKTPDENAEQPASLTPGRPLGRGPKFPGREELINEGPFPLKSRIAQLATHVYYLWGEAKFADYLARGGPAENAALNLEHFARQAHHAASQLLEDSHVPTSRPPPYLPVEVSAAPLLVPGWRKRKQDFL